MMGRTGQDDTRWFMPILKVSKFGTSMGIILPEEVQTRLGAKDGDTLFAMETSEGYLITPYDPAIAEQLEAGREFMKEYRDTFKALAE